MRGGSRRNVVAAEAYAEIDVRVPTAAAVAEIETAMRAIAASGTVSGTMGELTGGINRPPMERTDAQDRLLAVAGSILDGWDIPVEPIGTGGGSDGNFTAAIGTPTLDALGPMGGGAHSPEEYLDLATLPDRIALVASLIAETVRREAINRRDIMRRGAARCALFSLCHGACTVGGDTVMAAGRALEHRPYALCGGDDRRLPNALGLAAQVVELPHQRMLVVAEFHFPEPPLANAAVEHGEARGSMPIIRSQRIIDRKRK